MSTLVPESWPGFVPAIHVLLAEAREKDVDARDKRGHDDDSIASERIVVPVEGKRWFEHP
jgi:hypothetical protein